MKPNSIPSLILASLTATAYMVRGDTTPVGGQVAPSLQAVDTSRRDGATWLTNLAEAKRIARAGHKSLLLDFTGSDWCGWCMKMDREIFTTPEFKDYARKHLMLVKVDFPRRKSLSPEEQNRNEQLAERYDVQGFPTLLLLDSGGRQFGTMGYVAGGPEAFLAQLSATLGGN